MKPKNLICISCPIGCKLQVVGKDGEYSVSGNKCARGKTYAIAEVTNPRRMLTSTVRVKGSAIKLLAVRTKDAIAKGDMFKIMRLLDTIEVAAPVRCGQVIVSNVLSSGVDIIASRSVG